MKAKFDSTGPGSNRSLQSALRARRRLTFRKAAWLSLFVYGHLMAFQPPVDQLIFTVPLNNTSPQTHNGFTLTRQVIGTTTPVTIQYTLTRPAPQSPVLFQKTSFLATSVADFDVTAAFLGNQGLLFRVLDRNGTTVHLEADFFDLSQANPVAQALLPTTDFQAADNPSTSFSRNTDGSCLFTFVGTSSGAVFDITVFRTDTGAILCQMPDQSVAPNGQILAQILDNFPPPGSDTIQINYGTLAQACPLPLPDLAVAPQPLAFGSIVNTTNKDLTVTFSNPGADVIQVTALGSSAHFAPVGFAAFTLQPHQNQVMTVRFTPGGANGPFDETLAITRTPAFGVTTVECTGSATTPVANLAVAPQPLTFGPVVNNVTRDLPVTFSNPGQLAVQVTALGASAHFSPVGFAPFTLQGGQSTPVTIRFNPGGAVGGFDETLAITRNPAVGAASVRCTGTGTLPGVSVSALTCCVNEAATQGVAAFRISRTGSTAASLTVNIQPNAAAAGFATPGVDYVALPATVTIPAGAASVDVPLVPINDTLDEPNEPVPLTLAAGTGYVVVTPASATVTITDDDPPPAVRIVGRAVPEGNGVFNVPANDPFKVVADVTLSAPSGKTISVDWHTFLGAVVESGVPPLVIFSTATSGTVCGGGLPLLTGPDFVTNSGTLVFAPGVTAQTITVEICNDVIQEPDEIFFIGLSSPVNATLGTITTLPPGQAICTILNDDLLSGSFDLVPTDSTVASDDRLSYAFSWTVPAPENWHALQTLQLRIRDGEDEILAVLFDEATGNFSIWNEAAGKLQGGWPAGSQHRLETDQAVLNLSDSSVVGSGPTGPSVTLNLSLGFKPKAAGRTYVVEVAATDDLGHQDDFTRAGTLTITPQQAPGGP